MSEDEQRRDGQRLKNQVVDELKDYFSAEFRELKRDFRADTEWAAESARKKVRLDNSITLKNLSNRKQFSFNNELDDLLDSVGKAINLRDADKARDYIKEAKDKIKHRNKLIRIADSSSAGWGTIQEYELYDVASDSDDDRRIRKAEERAKAKLEKQKSYDKPVSVNSNFQSFRGFRRGTGRVAMEGYPHQRGPVVEGNPQPREPFVEGYTQQRGPAVCYKCGQLGHFAARCDFFHANRTTEQTGSESSGTTKVDHQK